MREWPTKTVAELEERGVLLVEDGNHGEYRPRPDEFGSGSTAFIRAADMDSGRVRFESASRINEIALARIRKGVGRGGDILFSHKGTVGKLARVPLDAPGFVCSPQTTFWRTLDESRLDRAFLYAYMQSPTFCEQWSACKGETDMADYASLTAQRRFTVALPQIAEQRAIGALLGSLDDKIDLNRRMNQTLEEMASALFRSWFVDFDPVVAKASSRQPFGMDAATAALFPSSFEDSELGPIPKGWRWAPLDAVAKFVNGLPLQRFPPDGGATLPVIKIAQLRAGTAAGAEQANTRVPPEYVIHDGDLIFSWSGSLLVELWGGGKGALNQHLFRVTSATFPKWFCFRWLRYHLPAFQGIAADKATTMGHIRRHHLTEALVLAPPVEMIRAMDTQMAPLLDLSVHNTVQSRTLAALRDALLPKLLSGEIRLCDAEREVEAIT